MIKSKKIVVVCGGISTEREVSLRSGAAVFGALQRAGFQDVTLFDLTAANLSELLAMKPECVFLALHGKGGEDGCIQGALELAGIPYTGPGVLASAMCMNKITTKQSLAAHGIATAAFHSLQSRSGRSIEDISVELIEKVGLPMVVKSPCQGSSIGVVLVHNASELIPALEEVYKYGEEVLAEQMLDGTEISIPVVGNDDLTVYPIIEITSEREFYDYTAKYTQGLCHHIIPARISAEDAAASNALARVAYKALGCRGLSRIDIIIDKTRGPQVIEINTLPGMTDMSLVPDSARSAGVSFEELVTKIIELALEK